MFSFGKPSQDKFARQLRDAIVAVAPDRKYEYDAEQFRLVRLDAEGEVNLANMYQEHCSLSSRKERKAHLQRLVLIFAPDFDDLPDDVDEAKPNLRPKVWLRYAFADLELRRQLDGGKPNDIPLYPLGSHLYSSVVYDTEHAMRTISNADLDAWGLSYYEALEIARHNLDESTLAFATIGDSFCSSQSGDNYDSSRVLLLDRIRSFEIPGDLIATVPQRDSMYVAGSEDETALKILFDLTAKAIAEDPRPLSPLPLILQDDEWIDWVPPRDHPSREQYDDLELHFLGGLYTDQEEKLDRLFEGQEDAPFVTSFSALQHETTQKLSSYCVWAPGIVSLLPRTRIVVFPKVGGVAASGEWDHVVEVVGSLMVPDENYYPVRYRVSEFPSDEQLARIGTLEP